MTQRYKAYFTVPTGRQSPPSAANSSASNTPVLSTSSKRKQPSSYVSIENPQGLVNPFKFHLNLVVNVQPMDNNEQQQRLNGNVTSNGGSEDGEGRTMSLIDNLSPIPKQPATNVKENPQQFSLNGSGSIGSVVEEDPTFVYRDDNYGPSTSFTCRARAQSGSRSSQDSSKGKTPTNRRYKNKQSLLRFSTLNKSRNNGLRTSLNDKLLPRRLSFNESDGNEEVFRGGSTDFRPSQASLKDKRKIQTTGNRRYKNKKSLLSFASLEKPRSKSTGTALPGFQHYPRPRPLSFNESDISDETMKCCADKTLVQVGAVEAKSSFSHTSQDSFNGKNGAETDANKEIGAVRSKSFNTHFPQDPSKLAFSSFKKPRSKSTGTALPGFQPYPRPRRLSFNETMRSDADKSLVEVGAVEAESFFSHTSQDSFNGKNGAVTYANTPVPLEPEAPIYNHQRQFRVGFIMNGVQTAVNCMVNIRSNDEKLYVEPVELLYEDKKMWRRPIRQVTKEMEEKIAADKKK